MHAPPQRDRPPQPKPTSWPRKHAALLRHLYSHPKYRYREPPTATRFQLDLDRAPLGLFWVTDFVQNTFSHFVMPFLPAAARCRALANPWAHADASIRWAWEWDADADADAQALRGCYGCDDVFRTDSAVMGLALELQSMI